MKILGIVLSFLCCCFYALPLLAVEEQIHILYLNSYDARMNWYKGILLGIEEILEPDENRINLHLEHLDSKEFTGEEYNGRYVDYLRYKYRNHQFSLIMCSDNNAYDLLLTRRNDLFPGVPMVFSGVNDFDSSTLVGQPDVTGVAEIFSARETVDAALAIHPETEEIYIINDYLKTGRAWQRSIAEQLAELQGVRLRYSENLSMQELLTTVESLSEKTLILLGVYYSDRDGQFATYEETGKMISRASKVPIYCLVEFNLHEGVVGGKLISGVVQGRTMAKMGLRILNGEDPQDIPVVAEGANQYVFNYSSLQDHNISENLLPEGSVVVNRPFSVYRKYIREISIFIGLFTILVVTVIALILNILGRRDAENSLRELAEATWEAVVIHDHGTAINLNKIFVSMFGFSREEAMAPNFMPNVFTPASLEIVLEKIKEKATAPYEVMGVKKDGTEFPIEIRVKLMNYKGRQVRVTAIRDLTEQKRMEQTISQSQKMQAIGTLAGGIAHDFNNILSGVLGFSDMGLMISEPGSRHQKYFKKIHASGKRARDLIRQILSFSRHSPASQQPVMLSDVIDETLELLRATLPSTIQIRKEIDNSVCLHADPVQMQQVIMNICTNAGLAMKDDGGDLRITLKKQELHNSDTFTHGLPEGMYARLNISDTGVGMPEVVRKRIFEPFFTTRDQGDGTGLGLSVVHGIISTMGGAINVYSEEGQGTSFTIFLPVYSGETDFPGDSQGKIHLVGGSERILFVDDEAVLTDLAREMLGSLGYTVTVVNSSRDALALFKKSPDAYDLLITDVTMPEMTGDVLVEKIREIRPLFPVLICSGYSDRLSPERLSALGVEKIVTKPLVMEETATIIREVLDGAPDTISSI